METTGDRQHSHTRRYAHVHEAGAQRRSPTTRKSILSSYRGCMCRQHPSLLSDVPENHGTPDQRYCSYPAPGGRLTPKTRPPPVLARHVKSCRTRISVSRLLYVISRVSRLTRHSTAQPDGRGGLSGDKKHVGGMPVRASLWPMRQTSEPLGAATRHRVHGSLDRTQTGPPLKTIVPKKSAKVAEGRSCTFLMRSAACTPSSFVSLRMYIRSSPATPPCSCRISRET